MNTWSPADAGPALRRRKALIAVVAAVLGIVAMTGFIAYRSVFPPPRAMAAAVKAPGTAMAAPPVPVEQLTTSDASALEKVDAADAVAINSRMPFITDLVSGATPLVVPLSDGRNWLRSLECLTTAIYYEAGNESADGQRAVAQVILNRVRDPAYPNTICGVVYQGSERVTGCQFSFTCDGSLARRPNAASWRRAQGIASMALGGSVFAPVGWSTHYHADYVVPKWAPQLAKVLQIGTHIFYRWPNSRGLQGAFSARYAGNETGANELLAIEPVRDATMVGSAREVAMNERPVIGNLSAPVHDAEEASLPTASERWILQGFPRSPHQAPAAGVTSSAAPGAVTQVVVAASR